MIRLEADKGVMFAFLFLNKLKRPLKVAIVKFKLTVGNFVVSLKFLLSFPYL